MGPSGKPDYWPKHNPPQRLRRNNQPVEDKMEEQMILVITSKVKEYIKSKGDLNVGGDVAEALSKRVTSLLDLAVERCQANGRKTVKGTDV